MKNRMFLLLALASLSLTITVAQNTSLYIYFTNGDVEAYPEEHIKSLESTANGYTMTLVDNTQYKWNKTQVDSISKVSPVYPQFTDFKLDDKLNDQLFNDVDGTIYADSVRLIVGGIGKWLTPSYKTNNKATLVYVHKDEQVSGQSRRRFAEDVVYTLSLPGHRRLAVEKVKDEIWSEPTGPVQEIALTASMLVTNAPSGRNQGLDKMIDNDPGTFFHSTYTGDPTYEVLPLDQCPYVSVTLNKAVSKIQFYYKTRTDTKDRNPHAIQVYASKDNKTWKEVAYFDGNHGIPPTGAGLEFTSPTITANEACRYWRFEATACNYKNYLCMSEFKLYEVVGTTSEPELIQPAQYAYSMIPLGREVPVRVTWLTDNADVPRVDINIEGGKTVTSKDYYLNADIIIQGNGVWPDFEDVVQIKGRGNSSWGASKKPYRLKFASSVKPFGMKKGKNWNLIAQAQTGSLLSNPVAHKIARMTGAAAAHDAIPIDLYMNGSYRGSYMFTQKVGLANNSVDLDDETQAVLIELDSYSETGQFRTTKYNLPVNIKAPDFGEDETVLTRDQIISDFNALTDAIYNNANYERYLDIDMLARFMLVNEFVLNAELGHPKSTFLYRENMNHMSSPYTFGPAWDFDWAYGYEGSSTYCITDPTEYYFDRHPKNPGRTFFMTLWESSDWIKYHYYFVWKDFIENHLQEVIDYVDDYYAFAAKSFKKNSSIWSDGYNYTTNVANMKSWLTKRANYIMESLKPYDGVKAPYHFGDSNSDGYIDDDDLERMLSYLYRAYITDAKLKQIDIDLNGEFSINDIAWVCTLIENTTSTKARRLRNIDEWSEDIEDEGEDSDDDELYLMPDNYAAQALRTQTRAEAINVSVAENAEKQGWDVTVNMNNQDSYVAFQMDFALPNGISVYNDIADIALTPRTESTHAILGGVIKDGSYRVVLYSIDNNVISDTQGALFTLTVSLEKELNEGEYPLTVKNIRMVKANGIEATINEASASIPVKSDISTIEYINKWPIDIYDLSGRLIRKNAHSLQGLHKGTYIINNQKIVIR